MIEAEDAAERLVGEEDSIVVAEEDAAVDTRVEDGGEARTGGLAAFALGPRGVDELRADDGGRCVLRDDAQRLEHLVADRRAAPHRDGAEQLSVMLERMSRERSHPLHARPIGICEARFAADVIGRDHAAELSHPAHGVGSDRHARERQIERAALAQLDEVQALGLVGAAAGLGAAAAAIAGPDHPDPRGDGAEDPHQRIGTCSQDLLTAERGRHALRHLACGPQGAQRQLEAVLKIVLLVALPAEREQRALQTIGQRFVSRALQARQLLGLDREGAQAMNFAVVAQAHEPLVGKRHEPVARGLVAPIVAGSGLRGRAVEVHGAIRLPRAGALRRAALAARTA
jgi:hypothetical protein